MKFKGIFFSHSCCLSPIQKITKVLFYLTIKVTYICDNKTNQFRKDTKKLDVKFLILHGCYFHGRYIMTTRRRQERRLKSEFAFFQSLYWLFLPTYFVNCRRTLLKLNFKGPYSSSEREIKFRRCLFTSSMKREIRHFRVAVVQKRERNTQKSVMHLRSCCFVY